VTTWSDIDIQITFVANNAIRSDGTHPIRIEGRILEVGGSGNSLSNLTLGLMDGNSSLSMAVISWDEQTGGFVIQFTADRYLTPGDLQFVLTSNTDPTRYLNTANTTVDLFLRVRVAFDIEYDDVAWGSHSINGSVTARDYYTSQAVPDLSIEVHLRNESAVDQLERVGNTNGAGIWTFEFDIPESMAPFSDQDTWGALHLWFNSTAPELDGDSRADLARPLHSLTYESESQESEGMSAWVWAALSLLVIGVGAGAWILYSRRKDAIDELAEIFSYTAELLASGDEIREAIFNCYEELCGVLMSHGFLRRDFETVREFEMAIRKAMPISDEALTALDNMFEIARYSRHELNDGHRQEAVAALQRTVVEFTNMAAIPER
jgi:hypothetical protein